jgi:peptide/nickel transport system permease protein
MQRFILFRVLQAIFTIFVIGTLVFFFMRLSGDPVTLMVPIDAEPETIEAIKVEFGLDKPMLVQYGYFLKNAITGDFGMSFKMDEPALALVWGRFPATLELAITAALLAWLIGIPLGLISAITRDSLFDRFGKAFALFGQATPSFWLGVMMMLFFGVQLDMLPIAGREEPGSLIMPSLTISLIMLAAVMRLARSAMLDALNSEFVVMARIKGIRRFQINMIHAFKNASIPLVTMMSLQISRLLMGAVIAETIFSWPGVGKLALDSVYSRDFPVVQVIVLFSAIIFCTINILVDIVYAYIDPRIRY